MNDIYLQSIVNNCRLNTELDAITFVVANINLFLAVDQGTHFADHACVLRIEGEDDAVDEENETDAEENYEVGLALCEEHVGAAVDVVREVVVRDPHVGQVQA